MINYLIIEDEPSAVRRLKRKLLALRPLWNCVGVADGVESGIDLIDTVDFDLVFSDIELSDGSSFEIFSRLKHNVPIIFITAFSEYAVKAFDFNSVHYLLKPIKDKLLNIACEKYENNPSHFLNDNNLYKGASNSITSKLISRVGQKTTIVEIDDIVFIYHTERITRAYLNNGSHHLLDQTLDALTGFLPERGFYRINRQAIVNRKYISAYSKVSSNRLLLSTNPKFDIELIVSKVNHSEFKAWVI